MMKKRAFTVTCNLYQIPWFSTNLPDNIVPKQIVHSYTTTNKISNKVSWKTLTPSSDYDFMNMLPSNVTKSDIENLSLFQVSFQSQLITDSSGKQIYPNTLVIQFKKLMIVLAKLLFKQQLNMFLWE